MTAKEQIVVDMLRSAIETEEWEQVQSALDILENDDSLLYYDDDDVDGDDY